MKTLGRIALYARTAKHLRPRQIVFRVIKTLKYKILYRYFGFVFDWLYRRGVEGVQLADAPYIDSAHMDNLTSQKREMEEFKHSVKRIRAGIFCFLNHTEKLKLGDFNWVSCYHDRLWLYNLNYFDYLIDLGVLFSKTKDPEILASARSLIEDWIAKNPPGTPLSWDPYPTSIRVRNWMRAYYLFEGSAGSAFWDTFLNSLYNQVRFLVHNLEYDLEGNHLLEGYLSILVGGYFFLGKAAERWRLWATRMLGEELRTQLLQDGGHFERSPMYHSVILEHLLDCLSLLPAGSTASSEIQDACERMLSFLQRVRCKDGEIPLFGDSALGIASSPAHILQYASAIMGEKLASVAEPPMEHVATQSLEGSGFYRISTPYAEMTINGAGISSQRQPGHAHCDIFSYELCVRDKRMIVDTGVCCYYADSQLRQYSRSTKSHNTLSIDGHEQHEIWGNFRIGRRARVLESSLQKVDGCMQFTGVHDGFSFLVGAPLHQRWIRLLGESFFVIIDSIAGGSEHLAESFVHLHPEVSVDASCLTFSWGDEAIRMIPLEGTKAEIEEGWYFPEFGKRLRNNVVKFTRKSVAPFYVGYIVQTSKNDNTCLSEDLSVIQADALRVLQNLGLKEQTQKLGEAFSQL